MRCLTLVLIAATTIGAIERVRAAESTEYLYRLHCSGCHGLDGEGSSVGRIPPFPGIVGHFAGSEQGRLYLANVPGVVNAALPDGETADLLNYVLRVWGTPTRDRGKPFTAEEVHHLRARPVDDITALRQALAVELAKKRISIAY
ncbi:MULTISPECIES: hypothetical protein [unclassified Bradyrhizobium]|uniref:hypothetical protein n=1 Tax=unclassified Bradyrhizobium TaxID=2631580 RepID=UPI0028E9FBE9|nr:MULTISPECIES: hypothetical protein [unclassified Bradyrhizobium]